MGGALGCREEFCSSPLSPGTFLRGEALEPVAHRPQFRAETEQETLERQQEGGGASDKLKERNLVLRSRGQRLPPSLPGAAPAPLCAV